MTDFLVCEVTIIDCPCLKLSCEISTSPDHFPLKNVNRNRCNQRRYLKCSLAPVSAVATIARNNELSQLQGTGECGSLVSRDSRNRRKGVVRKKRNGGKTSMDLGSLENQSLAHWWLTGLIQPADICLVHTVLKKNY